MGLLYRRQPVKAVITAPARAFGTIYQNTTGRPLLVIVSVVSKKQAESDDAYGTAFVKATSPPDVTVASAGQLALATSAVSEIHTNLVFMVPNEYYYQITSITSGTGLFTIIEWTEVEL